MRLLPALHLALLTHLCLLSPAPLRAQSILLPPVVFVGASAYSQAALLAFTDLHPGSIVTNATLVAAAQRLNDTGLFRDIRYGSTPKGLIFTLTPMPPEVVLTASFPNFPWWQPAELDTLLKARVPLYLGSVPTSGNLQQAVTDALTALVKEKGVAAPEITALPLVTLGAAPTSIEFSLTSPAVLVHNLSVQHVSPAFAPRLSGFTAKEAGKPWNQGVSTAAIHAGIAEIYRDAGYLDIDVTSLTHPPPTVTPGSVTLDLVATVSEGEPYRLTALTWAGSDLLSTADFNKTVTLHPEDVASQTALRNSLRPLANALFSHGYQDGKVQAPATLDRATHHVSYTVRVIPGEQYRIRTVKTVGLTAEQQKEFDSGWRLHPGDPYDTVYVSNFLVNNTALRSLGGHSATYKAVSSPEDHLVDLTITFVKGGVLR